MAKHKRVMKGGYKGGVANKNDGTQHGQASKPAKKPPLTHFLCVPLVTHASRPQLEASLDRFKRDVLNRGPTRSSQDANTTGEFGHQKGSNADPGGHVPLPTSSGPPSADKAEEPSPTKTQKLDAPPSIIPEKAIRPVGTLHLTLGVMSLMTPERVQEAIDLLQNLDLSALLHAAGSKGEHEAIHHCENAAGSPSDAGEPQAELLETLKKHASPLPLIDPEGSPDPTLDGSSFAAAGAPFAALEAPPAPLVISLSSLQSMHPPRKTSILYAKPDDVSGRLQPLCEELRNRFTDADLLLKDTRPLKLHATIVNTIYAKTGGRRGGKGERKPRQKSKDGTHEQNEGEVREEGSIDEVGTSASAGDTTTVSTRTEESSIKQPAPPPTAAEAASSTVAEGAEGAEGDKGASDAHDRSSGHGPNAKAPLRFDATTLLPQYANFVWAEGFTVGKVAICKMGAKKTLNEAGVVVSEEYEEVASKTF